MHECSLLPGVCQPYSGTTCSHLPGYNESEAVYVDRYEAQWDRDGQSRAELWMLMVLRELVVSQTDLPQGCTRGVQELLCHRTLPLCYGPSKRMMHLPLSLSTVYSNKLPPTCSTKLSL